MENIPIFTGRDINTGVVSLLRATGGTLLTTAGTLNDLSNVNITTGSLATGQVLKYDNSTSKWLNQNNTLSDLSDVFLGTLSNGQFLRYNGSIWQNVNRDYININMFGTSNTSFYSTTTFKAIMAGIAANWQSPIPNPATNTNGNMYALTSPLSSVFDTTTGFITVNSTKKYTITATINQGRINYNAGSLCDLAIYDASSGTATAFSPNIINTGAFDIDFAGMGVSTTGVFSGVSKIAVMFRYQTAQTIAVNPTDTSITVSIMEL